MRETPEEIAELQRMFEAHLACANPVANGTVVWITREHIDHDEIHAAWQTTYDSDPYTWGDAIFFRIAPISMWAYAFHPEEFPAA